MGSPRIKLWKKRNILGTCLVRVSVRVSVSVHVCTLSYILSCTSRNLWLYATWTRTTSGRSALPWLRVLTPSSNNLTFPVSREIEEEFGPLSASVPVNLSAVGPPPKCPLCKDVELKGELQNVCATCETTVCLNCGVYDTNPTTKVRHIICVVCRKITLSPR